MAERSLNTANEPREKERSAGEPTGSPALRRTPRGPRAAWPRGWGRGHVLPREMPLRRKTCALLAGLLAVPGSGRRACVVRAGRLARLRRMRLRLRWRRMRRLRRVHGLRRRGVGRDADAATVPGA